MRVLPLVASLAVLTLGGSIAACTIETVPPPPDAGEGLDAGPGDGGGSVDAFMFPPPTEDTCTEASRDATLGERCAAAAECDDGCFCNGVEACEGGGCVAGEDPCPDEIECTADVCLEETNRCFHDPQPELCSDGDACNGAEICDLFFGCTAAAPLYCNDESSCTVDSCDPASGCVFSPRDLDGDGFTDGRCGGDDCDDDPRFGRDIYPGAPEDLLLAPSESDDAYDRFTKIMERINENVLTVFLPNTLIPLHAIIVLEWMKGFSLPTMIRRRIEYLQRRGSPIDTAKVIRKTLEIIEGTARFLAPRYFSAYVDVLNQHLREIGREDLIDNDLEIGVALEFGVTSITMRSLMELGLSRISAVALYEVIALDGLDEVGCIEWIQERREQLDSIGLPAIVVREVRDRVLAKVSSEED